ncbi:hypothetical protein BGZ75_002666 [Mortierella antarctica]|nr:hypothetical protein BGZ75_002666 [Mortierella antarctica]
MATVLPPSRAPSISTAAPLPIATSALPPRVTTPRPTTHTARQTNNVSQPVAAATATATAESSEGMSGGAVAGLVVGALVILICSVVGGFLLLKKRRRRLMAAGKRSSYYGDYTASSARTLKRKQDNDDYGSGVKKDRAAGLSDMWSGLRVKAQKVADSITKPSAGAAAAAPPATTPGAAIALQPLPPLQLQQPYQHARAMSPAFVSGSERAVSPAPTHMNGVLPPTGSLHLPQESYMTPQQQPVLQIGYANSVYSQGSVATGPHPVGHPAQQQQYQQPYMNYQQPSALVPTPTPTITTPASQPYYYQPGTGLVSVPLVLPHAQQQPFMQQQQYQNQQQMYQQNPQPPAPGQFNPQPFQPVPPPAQAVNNIVYPAPAPVPLAPPSQHHHHHHQAPPSLQQVPVLFPQPPPSLDTSVPISVDSPTRATPDAGSIFLPGDATRPLLGQGLFKIVPDAEDEEEAKRALKAGAVNDSSVVPPLDLHLGGDFLSSVIQYQNQEKRFQALEAGGGTSMVHIPSSNDTAATESSTAPPPLPPKIETAADVVAARLAGNSQAPATEPPASGEFQEYRREGGYHDRLAGQKDRPKNQPRYLLDKEEVMDEKQEVGEIQEDGSRVPSSQEGQHPSDVVIVGSDIVFEPLPSVKAAAKAAQRASMTGIVDAETSGEVSTHHQSSSSATSIVSATPASSVVGLVENSGQPIPGEPVSPRTPQRGTTIGMALPTIGTEEYLERTDDKEEYSFGLHGDRRTLAGSSGDSTVVMHPPTVTALANEAQGDIVYSKAQEVPTTPLTSAAPAESSSPSSSSSLVPPPIARSTKPKLTK